MTDEMITTLVTTLFATFVRIALDIVYYVILVWMFLKLYPLLKKFVDKYVSK